MSVTANYFNAGLNKPSAIKLINNWRKNNKNKWVFFGITVNETDYHIKFFDTYIQRIENKKNGIISGAHLESVSEFTAFLNKHLN